MTEVGSTQCSMTSVCGVMLACPASFFLRLAERSRSFDYAQDGRDDHEATYHFIPDLSRWIDMIPKLPSALIPIMMLCTITAYAQRRDSLQYIVEMKNGDS